MYMLLWIAVIIQRLTEVMIAKRNEMWMKNRGGIVIHEPLYKWIVTAHVLFLISLFFGKLCSSSAFGSHSRYLFNLFPGFAGGENLVFTFTWAILEHKNCRFARCQTEKRGAIPFF